MNTTHKALPECELSTPELIDILKIILYFSSRQSVTGHNVHFPGPALMGLEKEIEWQILPLLSFLL